MFGSWAKEVTSITSIMKRVIPFTLDAQKKLGTKEIQEKNDGTIVSICDFATQALIMSGISELLPGDDFFGEEEIRKLSPTFLQMVKELLPADVDPVSACSKAIKTIKPENHRTWLIDPIDGTEGFVKNEAYAIATALLVDLKLQVSITAWPLHEPKYTGIQMQGPIIFIAIEGGKSYAMDLNDNVVEMPVVNDPEDAILINKFGRIQKHLAKNLHISNRISLVSMVKGFILASGKANLYARIHLCPENSWDIAPFELFLRNCGGIITLGNGNPIEYLPNGTVKDSACGIICTMGGPEFHHKALDAVADSMNTISCILI